MDNLELWRKVEATPKEQVFERVVDNRVVKSTPSINRLKKATEMFGLYGKAWGLKSVKHSEIRVNNGLLMGVADAVFFVDADKVRTEFEISTSMSIATVVGGEYVVNTAYRKAMESELINKALSRLGFFADLYADDGIILEEGEVKRISVLEEMELVQIGGSDERVVEQGSGDTVD